MTENILGPEEVVGEFSKLLIVQRDYGFNPAPRGEENTGIYAALDKVMMEGQPDSLIQDLLPFRSALFRGVPPAVLTRISSVLARSVYRDRPETQVVTAYLEGRIDQTRDLVQVISPTIEHFNRLTYFGHS